MQIDIQARKFAVSFQFNVPPGACTATAGGPDGERFRGGVEVIAVAKEWERKMAQMRGDHDEEVAAVREEADAELSRGRKELSDRVSYLNQELQVCSLMHLCLLKIMVSHLGE